MFRPITITAVLNGWLVDVGCQRLVFQDRNQLTTELDAYLKDPHATEERFLKTSVNKDHTNGNGVVGVTRGPDQIRIDPPFHSMPETAAATSGPSTTGAGSARRG